MGHYYLSPKQVEWIYVFSKSGLAVRLALIKENELELEHINVCILQVDLLHLWGP